MESDDKIPRVLKSRTVNIEGQSNNDAKTGEWIDGTGVQTGRTRIKKLETLSESSELFLRSPLATAYAITISINTP